MRSPTPPERVRFLPSVLHTPRSSSRPGCRSLTPVTRVRTPLGALLDATVVSGRKHTALPALRTGFESRRSLSMGLLVARMVACIHPSGVRFPGAPLFPQIENRSRGSRSRESLKASPVGAATAAWAIHRAHAAGGRHTLSDAPGGAARLSPGWGGFDSRRERLLVVAQRIEHHPATVGDGGSNPPGEIRRRRAAVAAAKPTPSGIYPPKAGIREARIPRWRDPAANEPSTTGRLGRRRSDMAVERGSIPRSSISP